MPARQTPDDDDAENVIAFLTEPRMGVELCDMVCRKLWEVEGFRDLPKELRNRIEEQAALIYAAGYLHAVKTGRD